MLSGQIQQWHYILPYAVADSTANAMALVQVQHINSPVMVQEDICSSSLQYILNARLAVQVKV